MFLEKLNGTHVYLMRGGEGDGGGGDDARGQSPIRRRKAGAVTGPMKSAWEWIKDKGSQAGGWIADRAGQARDWAAATIWPPIRPYADAVEQRWQPIGDRLSRAWTWVDQNAWTPFKENAWTPFKDKVWEPVSSYAGGIKESLTEAKEEGRYYIWGKNFFLGVAVVVFLAAGGVGLSMAAMTGMFLVGGGVWPAIAFGVIGVSGTGLLSLVGMKSAQASDYMSEQFANFQEKKNAPPPPLNSNNLGRGRPGRGQAPNLSSDSPAIPEALRQWAENHPEDVGGGLSRGRQGRGSTNTNQNNQQNTHR